VTSDSYTRARGYPETGQARRISPGFAMVLVLSVTATLALLILALVYYSGSSARIASDYTNVASPANRALTAELSAYAHDQDHNLPAARVDLTNEAKTEASFDNLLGEVAFPGAAATAADALLKADQAREKLIKLQAQAPTFRVLGSFAARVQAADAAVEVQVKLIRQALGLPAPSGQLF
jgi:hypothetical protein